MIRDGWFEHTHVYAELTQDKIDSVSQAIEKANHFGIKGIKVTLEMNGNELGLRVKGYNIFKRFLMIIKEHFIHDY